MKGLNIKEIAIVFIIMGCIISVGSIFLPELKKSESTYDGFRCQWIDNGFERCENKTEICYITKGMFSKNMDCKPKATNKEKEQ